MLHVTLDATNKIALLEPDGALSQNDFENAIKDIDPFIEQNGHLNGLIIHTPAFPGWDSFGALVSHLKFIKEHHKKVTRIALSTDSVIGDLAEHIGSHFISAEVKHFPYDAIQIAKDWILTH